MSARRSFHFVSLGCPKYRVDSEVMLGVAHGAGFAHVDDPAAAELAGRVVAAGENLGVKTILSAE